MWWVVHAAFLRPGLNGVLSVCVQADRDAPVLHCVSLLFALCVLRAWWEKRACSLHIPCYTFLFSPSPLYSLLSVLLQRAVRFCLHRGSGAEGIAGFTRMYQIINKRSNTGQTPRFMFANYMVSPNLPLPEKSQSIKHLSYTTIYSHTPPSKLWFPCRKSTICCHYALVLLLLSPPINSATLPHH